MKIEEIKSEENYEYVTLLQFLEKDDSLKAKQLFEKLKNITYNEQYIEWRTNILYKLFLQAS